MFNVYFPKMVENRMGRTNIVEASDSNPDPEGVMKSAMWNVVVFTLGGCPGAIVGSHISISSSFLTDKEGILGWRVLD